MEEDHTIPLRVDLYNTAKDCAQDARMIYLQKIDHLKKVLESVPQYPDATYIQTTGLLDGEPIDRFIIQEAIRYYERRAHEASALIENGKSTS